MYTIKRAAELTGISVATLRAWERRYGVVSPRRSEGGYRLYDADDVRALAIMNSLVNEGWSARQAAAETTARLTGDDPESDRGRPMAPVVPLASVPASASPKARRAADDIEALIAAAERLDPAAVSDVLDTRFAIASYELVVDDWLMPALGAVGQAWAAGRLSIAGEHLVSYAVQRRLAAFYEAASGRADGPTVLIGLPPDCRHELGLLAFAVSARRAGLATVYVGADLPAHDWVPAVRTRGADGVVLAVPRRIDIGSTQLIATRLLASHPQVVIGLGGRFQDAVEKGCVPLGHSIGLAVSELRNRLRRTA